MSLELKKGDRIWLGIDRSGSMNERDPATDGKVKYDWMQETLLSYVTAAERFAVNGVNLAYFNSSVDIARNVTTTADAQQLMQTHRPRGGTDTHLVINAVFNEHQAAGPGSTFLLVFTDGQCSDLDALKRSIVNVTNNIGSPEDFRIGFFPVGTVDSGLQAMFDELDEGLNDAKFDIVGVLEPDQANFEDAIAAIIDSSTTADEAASQQGYVGKDTTV